MGFLTPTILPHSRPFIKMKVIQTWSTHTIFFCFLQLAWLLCFPKTVRKYLLLTKVGEFVVHVQNVHGCQDQARRFPNVPNSQLSCKWLLCALFKKKYIYYIFVFFSGQVPFLCVGTKKNYKTSIALAEQEISQLKVSQSSVFIHWWHKPFPFYLTEGWGTLKKC